MPQTRIALLGFGNVGRAFTRYLERSSDPECQNLIITAVADSSAGIFLSKNIGVHEILALKEAGFALDSRQTRQPVYPLTKYLRCLGARQIDVLVETLPTNLTSGQPALRYILTALSEGIPTVTADKGPLIFGFSQLMEAARRSGIRLGYSGTTGVRAPDRLRKNRVLEIRGVLNGTTNHILTAMAERALSLPQALREARDLGIAEPDPAFDLDGWDTASKILILANEWMAAEARLGDVVRQGLDHRTEAMVQEARSTGRVVRLIGQARSSAGSVHISVKPQVLEPDSPFYAVSGTSKAALFITIEDGDIFVPGVSGREAIARTIAEDIRAVLSNGQLTPGG